MSRSANHEQLQSIHAKLIEIAEDTLNLHALPNGSIRESLDSVNRLAFMVEIEDHYQIAFEPEEEDQIQTLEDLIQMIASKLTATAETSQ